MILTSKRIADLWGYAECGIVNKLHKDGIKYIITKHLSRNPLNVKEKEKFLENLHNA